MIGRLAVMVLAALFTIAIWQEWIPATIAVILAIFWLLFFWQ